MDKEQRSFRWGHEALELEFVLGDDGNARLTHLGLPGEASSGPQGSLPLVEVTATGTGAAGRGAGGGGRSGRLPELGPEARELVHEAVATYKAIRADLPRAVPSWPLGLPGWDDPWIALALHAPATTYLTVWRRPGGEATVTLPTAPSAALVRITRTEPDAR